MSAPGLACNVKIESATFSLHDGALVVDGSFITEAHSLSAATASMLALRYRASMSLGTRGCSGRWRKAQAGHGLLLGVGAGRLQLRLENGQRYLRRWELHARTVGYQGVRGVRDAGRHSSATFEIRGWSIRVEGRPVYNRVSGPHHRLDVAFSGHDGAPARSLPHGLLGQAFSTPEHARVGKLDVYPTSGHFITSAMAEGAIDGEVEAYEVGGPHETRFVFSRFDGAEREAQLGASGDASTTD